MRHFSMLRSYRFGRKPVWSVGCSCGWLTDHPVRGDRSDAEDAFRAHLSEVASRHAERLMKQPPRHEGRRE